MMCGVVLDACNADADIFGDPSMAYHQLEARTPFFALSQQRLVVPHRRIRCRGAFVAARVPPAADLGHHLGDAIVSHRTVVIYQLGKTPLVLVCPRSASATDRGPLGSSFAA